MIVRFHQQLESDIWHTADLWSYSHISVLKATTARSPCRKIPKESIKAPFSQPRLPAPGVGLEGTDVLVKDTAGSPAPLWPDSATSLRWEGMLTPLTASMGQKSWTRQINKVEAVASQTDSVWFPVLSCNCWSANRYVKLDSLRQKMAASSHFQAHNHSPSGIHTAMAVHVIREVKPSLQNAAWSCNDVLRSCKWLVYTSKNRTATLKCVLEGPCNSENLSWLYLNLWANINTHQLNMSCSSSNRQTLL